MQAGGTVMEVLGQHEWVIIYVIVLGIATYELISVRRSLRRDREKEAALKAELAAMQVAETPAPNLSKDAGAI